MQDRYSTLSAAEIEVAMPSLDNLRVEVPMPAPPDSGELLLRFEELRREHAKESERAEGAEVQPGDEVLVDLIGYVGDAILPYSVRRGHWLDTDTDTFLPGLREGLVGQRVGGQTAVGITLPGDYPIEDYRGAPVHFGVGIKAARSVELPAPDSARLHRAIGLGESLDQTMQALAEQMLEERSEATRELAEHLMLQELVARCDIPLTEAQVDEEIRLRWLTVEGQVLQAAGVAEATQAAALAIWLTDPELRADAAQRLCVSALLKSLVVDKKLRPSEKAVNAYIDGFAEESGRDVEEIRSSLQQDQEAQQDLYGAMLMLSAMRYLMKRTEVEVVAARG